MGVTGSSEIRCLSTKVHGVIQNPVFFTVTAIAILNLNRIPIIDKNTNSDRLPVIKLCGERFYECEVFPH
jgi:hypothetical protein